MINIISRAITEKITSGPQKVVKNLIKGLDIIGYPYCINKELTATSQLWIHDDQIALNKASKLGIKAVVGPNIYILPKHIPSGLDLSNFVYIHPSKWAVEAWKDFGYDKRFSIESWPSGIDMDEFKERQKPNNGIVLIYFKQRYKEELDYVKKILNDKKIKFEIIIYGSYRQSEYVEKLSRTKYIIWLGRHESQGIALEEALAMNIPILVWDVKTIGQWTPTKKESKIYSANESAYTNVTSAPYFSIDCGIITKEQSEIISSIEKMELDWKNFEPREYVKNNLSIEKQAKDFINLFDKHCGISYEKGKEEKIKNSKKWINDKLYFKIYTSVKSLAKQIIKINKKIHEKNS